MNSNATYLYFSGRKSRWSNLGGEACCWQAGLVFPVALCFTNEVFKPDELEWHNTSLLAVIRIMPGEEWISSLIASECSESAASRLCKIVQLRYQEHHGGRNLQVENYARGGAKSRYEKRAKQPSLGAKAWFQKLFSLSLIYASFFVACHLVRALTKTGQLLKSARTRMQAKATVLLI